VRSSIEQLEDMLDEAGLLAANSSRLAGLREVLAGKPRGEDIDGWQGVQGRDV